MVRGAGWREPNPRLRRRGKNVLDIPLYRSDVAVEKLFSGNFTNEIHSQVIECSFAVGAEIH
jgi:hypothetical protein